MYANSSLPKLLAKENIDIRHGNYKTPWFDIKNRVLGLPMWKDMGKDVYDLFVGHEVGHALIDVYQLPVTGLEENVADQFASLMLSYTYDESTGDYSIGQDMLYNVGTWFWISNELYSVNPDDYPFWDTHNLDIQRFYNISCYAYGSDPQYNQDLVDEGYLPEDRAYWCEEEYLVMERAWSFLLKDFDNGFFD